MRTFVGMSVAALLTAMLVQPASADWVEHKSDKFRISLKLWQSIEAKEQELKEGWGGLHAQKGGLHIYGIAKLDPKATKESVQKAAARITGIPVKEWQLEAKRKGNGFTVYETGTAEKDNWTYIGAWGRNKHATYLLIVKTTKDDFARHGAGYKHIFKTVKVW